MARAADNRPERGNSKPWLTQGYVEYMRSPAWEATRSAALERADYRCARCGQSDLLEVHHRHYRRLGHEHPDDLLVLCTPCHQATHRALDYARRLDGWACRRWGEDWAERIDQDMAADQFEAWLDRRG